MATYIQLKDHDGNLWPIWLDTDTGNLSKGSNTTPQTAFDVSSSDTHDARISATTTANTGTRACLSLYGPQNDGINYHVTLAYGGQNTGILGPRFGIANSGMYSFVMTPATASQFGVWCNGARYIGIGNWNNPNEAPQAPLHVKGVCMADQFQLSYGGNPVDLYNWIVSLQNRIAALGG